MIDNDFLFKLLEFLTNEKVENGETNIKVTHDMFENGEHVAHSEKEYKDGKCVKNESFDERKKVMEKNDDHSEDMKTYMSDMTEIEKKNKELLLKVAHLSTENAKLKAENERMEKKLLRVNTFLKDIAD